MEGLSVSRFPGIGQMTRPGQPGQSAGWKSVCFACSSINRYRAGRSDQSLVPDSQIINFTVFLFNYQHITHPIEPVYQGKLAFPASFCAWSLLERGQGGFSGWSVSCSPDGEKNCRKIVSGSGKNSTVCPFIGPTRKPFPPDLLNQPSF